MKSFFGSRRHEEIARTRDVADRALRAHNPAIEQTRDRLGTPGVRDGQALGPGKDIA